jgi:hypothetical protein
MQTNFYVSKRWQRLASHFSSLAEFEAWQSRHYPHPCNGDSRLAEGQNKSVPVSLTNGNCFAPPRSTSVSSSLPAPPDLIFAGNESGKLRAGYSRRDYLLSKLAGYDVRMLAKIWPLMDKLKPEISRLVGMETSDDGSYRDYNFQNCYSHFVGGELLYDNKGGEWVKKYSCGESVCFWCRTRARKRTIGEYQYIIRQLKRDYKLTHVWRIQRTFAEELQDKIGQENIAKLRSLFLTKIKRLFGYKTRDNMAVISVVHPVGDSDLIKKYIHFHDIVIPVVYKNGNFIVRNIDRLDYKEVQRIWNECVKEIIPEFKGQLNPPHLIPHRLTSKRGWKKFCKGMRYDLRSFAKDFEKSAVALLKHNNQDYVIVKCQKKRGKEVKEYYWRIVSVEDYAQQWIDLCKVNKITVYGWLKRVSKLYEEGVLLREQDSQEGVELVAKESVQIEIVREKKWDPKKGRVVWVRGEYVLTKDGLRVLIDGKNLRWWRGSVPDGLQDVFAPATSPECDS